MQSLAQFLGTDREARGAEPESRLAHPEKLSAEEFAEAFLNSFEFRQYLVSMLALGDLPAAVITRLMDYAWGKPVQRLEFKDTTSPLDALTEEQLEARALQLAEMARQMREAREKHSNTRLSDSIH